MQYCIQLSKNKLSHHATTIMYLQQQQFKLSNFLKIPTYMKICYIVSNYQKINDLIKQQQQQFKLSNF